MESVVRAAGMADTSIDPTADPSRDVERNPSRSRLTKNPSRASLPISHRRSVSTLGGGHTRPNSAAGAAARIQDTPTNTTPNHDNNIGDGDGDEDAEDEIAWGPAHPCFPHPNPHVPLSSPLYESTRIIRIKRDWMVAGDEAPAFSNLYPEILDPAVPEDRFRALITKLNTTLVATFTPTASHNWFDAIMGLSTGWLWDDFGFTSTKRTLRALETWLQDWNRDVGGPEGVSIIPLRRTAYLCLDIQIPDPQISLETEIGGSASAAGGRESAALTQRVGSQSRGSGSARTSGSVRRGGRERERDEPGVEYGAYPVVPPIPDRYLEEGKVRESVRREREREREKDGEERG